MRASKGITLDALLSDMGDALGIAENIENELIIDHDALDAARVQSRYLLAELKCAETVETIEDFALCVANATFAAVNLAVALADARPHLQDAGDSEARKAASEARGWVAAIKPELRKLSAAAKKDSKGA